ARLAVPARRCSRRSHDRSGCAACPRVYARGRPGEGERCGQEEGRRGAQPAVATRAPTSPSERSPVTPGRWTLRRRPSLNARNASQTAVPRPIRTAGGRELAVTHASTTPEISSTGTRPSATETSDRDAWDRAQRRGSGPGRTQAQK